MYFNLHPLKVLLLDLGQFQRKVKYIRVLGDEINDSFENFSQKLRCLVDEESGSNGIEFFCFWIDYSNDEIKLSTLDDFWCWCQFLEVNKSFHPEIFVRPIFKMFPPVPRPFVQAFVAPPAIPFNSRPVAPTFFRPNAQPFFPARIQQGPRPQQGNQGSLQDSGYHQHDVAHPNGNLQVQDYRQMDEDMSPSPPPADFLERHLSPAEKKCLDQLKSRGYKDESGFLISIVEKVNGDFNNALSIVEEELCDTETEDNTN